MNKLIIVVLLTVYLVAGCFSFNLNLPSDEMVDEKKTETVLLANTNNVYRLATNTVLKVKVQKQKNSKWVDSELPVLIPSNWFIVCGDEIE